MLVWLPVLAIGKTNAYILMLPLQVAMVCTCCYLMYCCAEMTIGREKPAVPVFVWLLGMVFLGLDPMITQNYSDIPAMFLISICAWLVLRIRDGGRWRVIQLFLLGLISMFGYSLKPQITFVLIGAVLAVLLPEGIRHFRKYRKLALCVLALVLGMAIGAGCASAAVNSLDLELLPERRVGPTHYLMMGLNPEGMGIYSDADMWISTNALNYELRTQANIDTILQRLHDTPLGEYALHFLRKQLTNYNDGSFAWFYTIRGGEIINWCDMPLTISALSAPIRDFYTGSGFVTFQGLANALWLALLLLGAIGGLTKKKDGLSSLRLTLLGLTLFQILFEASPRYLYAFAPVYCLMAGSGLAVLRDLRSPRT